MSKQAKSSGAGASAMDASGYPEFNTVPNFRLANYKEPTVGGSIPIDPLQESTDEVSLDLLVDPFESHGTDFVHDCGFCEPLGDGSYLVLLPSAAELRGRRLHFPIETLHELPIPEEIEIEADGAIVMRLPHGARWEEEHRRLHLKGESELLTEMPQIFDWRTNPDGSIVVSMPEGIDYEPSSALVRFNNYWANKLMPTGIRITPNGGVEVLLPVDVERKPDGSFVLPSEHSTFLLHSAPRYMAGGPEWITQLPSGWVQILLPYDVEIDAHNRTLYFTGKQIRQYFPFLAGSMHFGSDGTLRMPAPEGAAFDPVNETLSIPIERLHPEQIPAGISYHVQDGQVTLRMPPGVEYSPQTGFVTMDNFWANRIAPRAVKIGAEGSVQVRLPPDTRFNPDGTITIPPEYADFMDNPPPDYVYFGPYWASCFLDGNIRLELPAEFEAEEGTLSTSIELFQACFEEVLPPNLVLNPDGTANFLLPSFAAYDVAANIVRVGAQRAHELMPPPELRPYFTEDGALLVRLPRGMEYEPSSHSVQLDNFWVNRLMPSSLEILPSGEVRVRLPSAARIIDEIVLIPRHEAEFLSEPQAPLVCKNRDWMISLSDGSIAVTPMPGMVVDAKAGLIKIPLSTFNADLLSGHGLHVLADGTAVFDLPASAAYEKAANALSFAKDSIYLCEIPPLLSATEDANGVVRMNLPAGVWYEPKGHALHFDNKWLNALTPETVEFTGSGAAVIRLPSDTQYFDGGSLVISKKGAKLLMGGSRELPHYSGAAPYPGYEMKHKSVDQRLGTVTKSK